MNILRLSISFLFCLFFLNTQAQQVITDPLESPDAVAQKKWVDSVYTNMSLKQRIAQLFMTDVASNASESQINKIRNLVKNENIGGIIFSKGGPVRQLRLQNELQQNAKVPLLIGMDAEWGLAMRLDSTFALPWNMTLGAIEDDHLVEQAGAAISRHAKRMGIHINFAPVVDINTNPDNPIIGSRSFGEEKENVTRKSLSFMRGMIREGIIPVAKHFPGHGDTNTDSHKTLPTVSFSKERIKSTELFPYKKLIEEGLPGVMVAHLNIPELQEKQRIPSSQSKKIVSGLLKDELDFDGLIFTDALRMAGAKASEVPGETDLRAFLAGNDVLLMSENVTNGIERIAAAYANQRISEERLAHSVKKVLRAKYKVGLHRYHQPREAFLYKELHTLQDSILMEKLVENSITLIKNNKSIIPVQDIEEKKIAYVNFGNADGSDFLAQLRKYGHVDWVSAARLPELMQKLEAYNYVILGFHKSDSSPWANYKFSDREVRWIHEISRNNTCILSLFTKPYALANLPLTDLEGILIGYQNSKLTQQKLAQVIFGGLEAKGRLPVSVGWDYPAGTAYHTGKLQRLAYGSPESVGLNSFELQNIDTIMNEAVEEKMTPGGQILVARKGRVVYQKNFGYHTYERKIPVSDTSVYDLASLTKILATLPLVMQQEEQGILNFETRLEELLPKFQNTDKAHLKLQDMLMHYARLKPWLPLYVPTIDKVTKRPSKFFYADTLSEKFNTLVANNMYIRNDMRNFILNEIKKSSLRPQKGYRYSDLPYYLLKYYLEDYYGQSLHKLTSEKLYQKLGANYTGYLPLSRYPKAQIVPTEEDKMWRRQRVHGYVHDQGAAMQGGIGGHAGLFSTANDVAKIMHMYLYKGTYGGERFLNPETVDKFNTCYYCEENVRRGVGFDKPQLGSLGPTCNCVSMTSFGHSGFTGTFAWADPEEEIVYVFLSNRTFPDSNNRKLIREDVRSKIQEVIYNAIDF